jgi:hypothetical protein
MRENTSQTVVRIYDNLSGQRILSRAQGKTKAKIRRVGEPYPHIDYTGLFGATFSHSFCFNSHRRIFPLIVLGKLSTNSIFLGYL